MAFVKKSDPAREVLRAVIAKHAILIAGSDAAHGAVQRGMAAMDAAISAVTAARKAVEQAKRDHADSNARAITAGRDASLDSGTLRNARLALADAEDQRDAAQQALDQLQADLEDKTATAGSFSIANEITVAIQSTIKPSLADLVRRGIQGRRDYLVAKLVMQSIQARNLCGPGMADELGALFAWQLPVPDTAWNAQPDCDRAIVAASVAAWERATADLRKNPDAPLPGVA